MAAEPEWDIESALPDGSVVVGCRCPHQLVTTGSTLCIKRFVKDKRIGEGMVSRVYKVMDKHTQMTLALKVYHLPSLTSGLHKALKREIDIHASMDHPNITPLCAAFRDGEFLCVLMPYARCGSLASCLRVMTRDERVIASRVVLPMLSALGYLHMRGIVHRDIKLENVLADEDGHVELTDLGFAIDIARRDRALTQLGTLVAMAPEVLLDDPSDPQGPLRHEVPRTQRRSYGPASDIWSLGVMVWELLTGTGLFSGEKERDVLHSLVKEGPETREEFQRLSPLAQSFIMQCLCWDDLVRATAEELYNHPFIIQNTRPVKWRELAPARQLSLATRRQSMRSSAGTKHYATMNSSSTDGSAAIDAAPSGGVKEGGVSDSGTTVWRLHVNTAAPPASSRRGVHSMDAQLPLQTMQSLAMSDAPSRGRACTDQGTDTPTTVPIEVRDSMASSLPGRGGRWASTSDATRKGPSKGQGRSGLSATPKGSGTKNAQPGFWQRIFCRRPAQDTSIANSDVLSKRSVDLRRTAPMAS